MSRIDFTPAETTATSVRESSVRSAETSMESSAPWWTPPSPPVTNTRMPASPAIRIVLATVVAPWAPVATTYGRSRTLTLQMSPSEPSSSSSSSSRPTVGRPSSTAMVAGTAPPSRTICSTSRAIATLCGYGMPWLMMVDSSATTGRPAARASATSGATLSIGWGAVVIGRAPRSRAGWGSGGPRRGRGSGRCGRCRARHT